MKMGEGVEWGVHCLVLLAAAPPDAVLPAKALAEFHEVSPSYLVKHLKALAAAGLLASSPGPNGGYRLGRSAAEITLLDAVLAIDGPAPAFRCTEIRRRGPAALPDDAYVRPCAVHAAMMQAEAAWRDSLCAVRIQDLVDAVAKNADPEAVRKTLVWFGAAARKEGRST